jgi:pimeloyl-ACP methyl ester carboxylesterase
MSPGLPESLVAARLSRRSAARLLGGAGIAALTFDRLRPQSFAANAAISSIDSTTSKERISMIAANQTPESTDPTVVLVHGAFADSSSWNGVIELLQESGVTVTAAPNPLRGLTHDAAYVASFLNQIPGPVLLVGHSYGGAVMTNAGSNAENVVGLVYVAAFAPDEGETLLEVEQGSRDSVLLTALVPLQYPTGSGTETATEFAIDPAKIQEAFAADLSPNQNAVIAATQRPIAEVAFAEKTGVPAWKTLPSWSIVPTGDKAVGADVVRSMAERAGATITEIDASHVVMISQPQAVTDVILTALEAVKSGATKEATVAAA